MSRRGRWSISRAASLVTVITAGSAVLGLGRDIVIAAVFGAGPALDAYLVAQGVMSMVLGLVASAVARSVTPVTAREASQEDGECRGHRGFDVALTVTLILLGLAAVVVGMLAEPVTTLIAPGFSGAQAQATASLTRIVLVATVLIAGTNLLAAVVQAHGRFAWSSLEGVPFNIVMIIAAAVFGPEHGVYALAVGFVVGSGARLLMQFPPVRSLRIPLRPRLDLRDPSFREIARLVPPMLVGTALVEINTMVDRAVASTLDEGAITALSYGWRLIHLPESLVVTALLVPLYPALGAVADDRPELRRLTHKGLSVVVTVLTPACVILFLAAGPVITLVFGHGAFDQEAIALTRTAIVWYVPGLLALGCRRIVVRASYAVGDARAPVVVAIIAMLINVVGDLLLAGPMGVAGIAVATTASLIFAAAANTWLLHHRHQAVSLLGFGGLLLRAGLAAGAALVAGSLVSAWLSAWPDLVTAAGIAVVVAAAYIGALFALRAPERRVWTQVLRLGRG